METKKNKLSWYQRLALEVRERLVKELGVELAPDAVPEGTCAGRVQASRGRPRWTVRDVHGVMWYGTKKIQSLIYPPGVPLKVIERPGGKEVVADYPYDEELYSGLKGW